MLPQETEAVAGTEQMQTPAQNESNCSPIQNESKIDCSRPQMESDCSRPPHAVAVASFLVAFQLGFAMAALNLPETVIPFLRFSKFGTIEIISTAKCFREAPT